MRTLRLILWFCLGIVLGGVSVYASAETIPATNAGTTAAPLRYKAGGCSPYNSTVAGAINACATSTGYTVTTPATCVPATNVTSGSCSIVASKSGSSMTSMTWTGYYYCPSGTLNGSQCLNSYTCPANQNWTLTGTNCTRPDCVEPETRNAVGVCQIPTCSVAANARVGSSRYAFPFPQPSGVTWCIQGCQVYPDDTGKNITGNTMYAYALVNGAGGAASTCVSSGNNTVPTATSPIGTSTSPPCTQQQGSISDGTGKVVCVDPTTPGATTPAVQSSSSKKTNYSDGSSSTTTVTNTCTGDGACASTTTTTVTGAGGGSTPGQAGTPGTTTTNSDDKTPDKSTLCAENPSLQICKGGMAEEGTQKQVLEEVKKISTAPTDTDFANGDDYDGLGLEGVDPDAKTNLDDTYKATSDALKVGFDSQTYAPKSDSTITGILEGWFESVPQNGCEPPEFAVAGHSLDLSGWCDQAAKISSIGAYALWFMTAVGLFVMVTGGKEGT